MYKNWHKHSHKVSNSQESYPIAVSDITTRNGSAIFVERIALIRNDIYRKSNGRFEIIVQFRRVF